METESNKRKLCMEIIIFEVNQIELEAMMILYLIYVPI
jgi:hypothetical protein